MSNIQIIENIPSYDKEDIRNASSYLGIDVSATIHKTYKINDTSANQITNLNYDESNYMFNAIDIYWNGINPNNAYYGQNNLIYTTGDLLKFVYNARKFPNSGLNLNGYATLDEFNEEYDKYDQLLEDLNECLRKLKLFDSLKNNNLSTENI